MIEAGRLVKYAGADVPPVQLGQAVTEELEEELVVEELVFFGPHVVVLELELEELELELDFLLHGVEEEEELDEVLDELEEELLELEEDRELELDEPSQEEVPPAATTAARPETRIAENFILIVWLFTAGLVEGLRVGD